MKSLLYFLGIIAVWALSMSVSFEKKIPKREPVTSDVNMTVNLASLNIPHDLVTDAGPRLHKIFDSLNDLTGVDTMFVNNGNQTYLIDTPVLFKRSKVVFRGNGDVSCYRAMNKHNWISIWGQRIGTLLFQGSHLYLYKFKIDVNNRTYGIRETDTTHFGLVSGLSLGRRMNGSGYPILHSIPTDVTIRKVKVYDWYDNGIDLAFTSGDHIVIDSCTVLSSSIIQGWSKDFLHVKGGQGISLTNADTSKITNNTIRGAFDDAVALHTGDSVLIRKNYITTTGGRILVTGGRNVLVDSNTIITYRTASSSGQLAPTPVTDAENHHVYFSKNLFQVNSTGSLAYFIKFFGFGTDIHIVDNTFQDYVPKRMAAMGRVERAQLNTELFGDSLYVTGNRYNTKAILWIKPGSPAFTMIDTSGNIRF